MNRKTTPFLAAAVLLLGLLAYLSERPRRTAAAGGTPRSASVINVPIEDVLRLRMKKDFWNSYMLAKTAEGQWVMEEPSRSAVNEPEVRRLLETATALPIVHALDMPGKDSEHHREYGLWTPSLEITLSAPDGATTLVFGTRTPDESGVYVTIHGQPRVYVIPTTAFDVLQRNADTYRKAP